MVSGYNDVTACNNFDASVINRRRRQFAVPSTWSMMGLQTIEQREEALLAPYAMFSKNTRGRQHPQTEHPYRGPFQRDRDRILHSAAYRRLSGKMQVFTGDMGDYHRTRLTHTQEVASIARTMGRTLRLNEDLIEALALFHDIGHPPFGHAGEDALDECLRDEGGFSHNKFALTLANELEDRYPDFPGLNLSAEILAGQEVRADKQSPDHRPLLEVQLVDVADSITYDAHDTDDAVKLGLIELDELAKTPLIKGVVAEVRTRWTNMTDEQLRMAVVHELIDLQVTDVLHATGEQLATMDFSNATEARTSGFRFHGSPELTAQKAELEKILHQQVYRHPAIVTIRQRAQQQLRDLFEYFVDHEEELPAKFQDRAQLVGLRNSVGDYIGGMTDRFCDTESHRLLDC